MRSNHDRVAWRSGGTSFRACWTLALLAFAVPASAHTITGTVVGPNGPVKSARVEFHYESNPGAVGHQVITGSDGRFSGPAPDNQILFLAAFPPASSNLNSLYDGIGLVITRDHEVRMTLRPTVKISGEIRDAVGKRVGGTVELYSLTEAQAASLDRYARQSPLFTIATSSGSFSFEAPADFYSIHARATGERLPSGRTNVDARTNLSGVRVNLAAQSGHLMPVDGPRADRITVSPADDAFKITITGASGATEATTPIHAVNMMTGQATSAISNPDGGFTMVACGAPGATIALYHDPTGWYLPVGTGNAPGSPTTYVNVPNPGGFAVASGAIATDLDQATALTLGIYGARDNGQWIVRSTLSDRQWNPGETVTLSGTVDLLSKNLGTDVSGIQITGSLALRLLFDGAGRQHAPEKTFQSTELTPTGFAIERVVGEWLLGELQVSNIRPVGPGRARADWTSSFTIQATTPPMTAQPVFAFNIAGVPFGGRFLNAPQTIGGSAFTANAFWPLVEIGDPAPARLTFVLGLDEFDNGVRGTVAIEDRETFGLANHVALGRGPMTLAMRDECDGLPIRHRLEPFVPMLTGFDSLRVASPISFLVPSGWLRVKVHRPDGSVDDLGEAPFRQLQSRLVLTRSDLRQASGTAGVPAQNQLTTLEPRFDYAFSQPGRHLVELKGNITDIFGRTYEAGGTFELIAARTLDIDGSVIVGTPFHDGNVFSVSATLTPPVPAEVEIRVRHLPDSDASKAIETVARGRANRFGYLSLPGILMEKAGEFSVTAIASYLDADGVFWHGQVDWASVVATPDASVITHGRRGFQDASSVGQQWFHYTDDGAQPGDHVMYPFHSGDVMWMEDSDLFSGLADSPAVSIQDNAGAIASRIRSRFNTYGATLGSNIPFDARETAGELPLFSSGPDARSDWARPDQWGYAYMYAERPSVRVREMVSEDSTGAAYWRFRDQYHFQPGVGIEGDRQNDFKFQFGGAVFRDETDGLRHYGAYASFFVLIPERDPARGRIMPPFRGNGGGPDGGALMRLKGKDVDLFFHPTALRPGSVLEHGDRISIAGYSAPTLPSLVTVLITAPSGWTRTISGRANAIGYFHDPRQDLFASEPGVWKAKVTILFDGRTSAGQVTAPFPAGDVLGSRSGEFYFYVVDVASPQLEVSVAGAPVFVRPADGPITFTIAKPPALASPLLTYTITMPGFILEEGTKSSLAVTYDAKKLAMTFPNLDLYDLDDFAGVDTVTISLLLSGIENGVPKHYARQIVLQGEELQMPDQSPRPPRRRAVR